MYNVMIDNTDPDRPTFFILDEKEWIQDPVNHSPVDEGLSLQDATKLAKLYNSRYTPKIVTTNQFKAWGAKGGQTKGATKVRGDSEYYRRISAARKTKKTD